MHVMVWFMHNALFIHVMRWVTPPSVDRWERCGHAHNIWIIALVFKILSIMKYDVCGYWVANVTEGIGIEWHSTVQHPLSGGKKGEVWCGSDSNHASLSRGDLATQMITFFQLCVLGHIAVIEVYHWSMTIVCTFLSITWWSPEEGERINRTHVHCS